MPDLEEKTFLIEGTCDNEYNDGGEYAIVTLTLAEIKQIAERRKLFTQIKERDSELRYLVFIGSVEFYGITALEFAKMLNNGEEERIDPAGLLEERENQKFMELGPEYEIIPEEAARTDCDHMIVYHDGVAWAALDHYGLSRYETVTLPYEELFKGVL